MAHDVPAVTAAIRIIEALTQAAPDAIPAGRLASKFQLNRSSCYNILAVLQREGWVRNLRDRRGWTLGPKLLALAGEAHELYMPAVRDELRALSGEVGMVVVLTELDAGGRHLVLASAEQRTGVRVTVGVGDTLPFTAWALIQVVCAWSSPAERHRLITTYGAQRYLDETPAAPLTLDEVLATVRRRGYSVNVEETHVNLGAVAAPVFDHRGRVWRAVKCLGFLADLDTDTVARIGPKIRAAADRITALSGGVVPPAPPG